ncbi:MAG: pentapeptide repeat-containing protein, partial [Actinomycetota bacterium]
AVVMRCRRCTSGGGRLLLPETAYEPHVAGQIEPPELAQPSGSWWGPTVLALAIAAVAALAAGSAYLVVGGNAGSTAADQPTPTGALADGLRIAGRTATSGGGPAAGTEQGASPSADLPVGVTPTSGRTANTVEREAPTGADPTTTTPGNATTAVPDSPTTVDPQPAATTAAGPAAAPVGDFRDRVLTGDDLTNQDLRFYDFSGATLTGVDFSRSDLRQASFAGAVLDGVEFAGADISSADFTGAVVRNGVVNGFWREASPPINLP